MRWHFPCISNLIDIKNFPLTLPPETLGNNSKDTPSDQVTIYNLCFTLILKALYFLAVSDTAHLSNLKENLGISNAIFWKFFDHS